MIVQDVFPVSSDVFHTIRTTAGYGIRKGDQFVDNDWIKNQELQNQLSALEKADPQDQEEIARIQDQLEELKEHEEHAKHQSLQCQKDFASLENDPDTLIITTDFTKFNQVESGHVQDCGVVLASKNQVDPSLFSEYIIQVPDNATFSYPFSQERIPLPEIHKKKRKTKKEMQELGTQPIPRLRGVKALIQQKKKEKTQKDFKNTPKFNQQNIPKTKKYVPSFTFLHFLALSKADKSVSQTYPYVRLVFDILKEMKIFNGYKRVIIWSDGCGKHFKTYNTTYFASVLKQDLGEDVELQWNVLAPRRAHNVADRSFALLKRQVRKSEANYSKNSTLTDIAFCSGKVKNCYCFELDADDINLMNDQALAPISDSFMRDSFQFIFQGTGLLQTRKYSNKEDEALQDRELKQIDEVKKTRKKQKKEEEADDFWNTKTDDVYARRLAPEAGIRARGASKKTKLKIDVDDDARKQQHSDEDYKEGGSKKRKGDSKKKGKQPKKQKLN